MNTKKLALTACAAAVAATAMFVIPLAHAENKETPSPTQIVNEVDTGAAVDDGDPTKVPVVELAGDENVERDLAELHQEGEKLPETTPTS